MANSEEMLPLSEATVIDWLEDLDLPYAKAEELPDVEYAWALRAGEEDGLRVLAVQHGRDANNVRMQVSINIAPDHRDLLKNLDPSTRDAFYFDLKITLLQQPVGYALSYLEDAREILGEFTIGTNLFEDQISRGGFFRRLHQVRSATTLTVLMIQKLERFETWK